MKIPPGFDCHDLGDGSTFFTGCLPAALALDASRIDGLWEIHPAQYHEIRMHGRLVRTPRWQQAYAKDYQYTGQVNRALPLPPLLEPLLSWTKVTIDDQINGVLVNWYDGSLGHYIGRHRDSLVNMVVGAPIVTISFGEDRVFRLRPWPHGRRQALTDFKTSNGSVFVMPFETNLSWTHEVPASRKSKGRRISITFRAFEAEPGESSRIAS